MLSGLLIANACDHAPPGGSNNLTFQLLLLEEGDGIEGGEKGAGDQNAGVWL